MSHPYSFTNWLRTQTHRTDVVGDLARDCYLDRRWPKMKVNLAAFQKYLGGRSAKAEALKALREAYSEYEMYKDFSDWRSHL